MLLGVLTFGEAGGLKLIYIDLRFDVGADFSVKIEVKV